MTQEQLIQESNAVDGKKRVPPYIPFLTFSNLLSWLETEGVPVRFDRSFWGKKYAGGMGGVLIAGLRFLGLLEGDYTKPLLSKIVEARGEERRGLLAETIKQAYGKEVNFSQLSGGTPGMLKEWFAAYGLDGSTDRKARSFFVNACKAYGVAISRALMKTARNKAPGGTRTIKKDELIKPDGIGQPPNQDTDMGRRHPLPMFPTNGQVQDIFAITLSDGGVLKLCSSRGFFDMEKTDRTVVESIVERMKEHRRS